MPAKAKKAPKKKAAKKGDKWIQKAKDSGGIKKGGLHKSLGVASGKKLTHAQKVAASHSKNPKVRKQGQLALNFEKMGK